MYWLNLWVNTFLRKVKAKYTWQDGLLSVVYSSVIIGLLNFLSSLMDAGVDVVSSLAVNVIVMPIAVLALLAIFIAVFRWTAKMHNGKGSFKKDLAVVGTYLGSFIFVAGIVSFIMGLVMAGAFSGADVTAVNFFLIALVMGIMFAAMAYLAMTVLGVWLQELAVAEKLDIFSTAKAVGLSLAIIIIVAAVVLGAFMELSLGPYKAALAQYGTTGV